MENLYNLKIVGLALLLAIALALPSVLPDPQKAAVKTGGAVGIGRVNTG